MRRNRGWWAAGVIGVLAAGCHATPDKHDTRVPLVEEFKAPPDESRFNNPEERTWKEPPPKKDFKPGFGAGGGAGGGGPGGGGGGGGMGGMNR